MNYITGTINYFLYLLGYENKNNKDFEDPGDFIIFDFPKPEKTWKSLMENKKKENVINLFYSVSEHSFELSESLLKSKVFLISCLIKS
jgi:hypothetical protein